jgi:hypothetical protein
MVIDGSWKMFCYFILKKDLKGAQISHIWKAYLTVEIVRQDKCPK